MLSPVHIHVCCAAPAGRLNFRNRALSAHHIIAHVRQSMVQAPISASVFAEGPLAHAKTAFQVVNRGKLVTACLQLQLAALLAVQELLLQVILTTHKANKMSNT